MVKVYWMNRFFFVFEEIRVRLGIKCDENHNNSVFNLVKWDNWCTFAEQKFQNMRYKGSQERKFSTLGRRLKKLMLDQGLTVSAAESLTGGTIASMIAQIPGSSAYFKGSVTSYAVSVKEEVLGVDVNVGGVVSESTAQQMAMGVARLLKSDCAVATTGIAGPGGAEPGKPVGTVCIAAICRDQCVSTTYHFKGSREAVILQSADAALNLLIEILQQNE